MINLLIAGAAGAALAYFMDPEQGARRRNVTRDRAQAMVRRGRAQAARYNRYLSDRIMGIQYELAAADRVDGRVYNDATLARKVETELFRDPEVPKGKININVEDGTVVLRGEARTPHQINALEAAARSIDGVQDVRNLLHLPKTPPATIPPSARWAA
jgi:osmotically-inducible protein OsmY